MTVGGSVCCYSCDREESLTSCFLLDRDEDDELETSTVLPISSLGLGTTGVSYHGLTLMFDIPFALVFEAIKSLMLVPPASSLTLNVSLISDAK